MRARLAVIIVAASLSGCSLAPTIAVTLGFDIVTGLIKLDAATHEDEFARKLDSAIPREPHK